MKQFTGTFLVIVFLVGTLAPHAIALGEPIVIGTTKPPEATEESVQDMTSSVEETETLPEATAVTRAPIVVTTSPHDGTVTSLNNNYITVEVPKDILIGKKTVTLEISMRKLGTDEWLVTSQRIQENPSWLSSPLAIVIFCIYALTAAMIIFGIVVRMLRKRSRRS